MEQESTRLNKRIAAHLGVGRRHADDLIASGLVTINGKTAELGTRVHETDKITVKGQPLPIASAPKFQYLLFHKPLGTVCSRRQQGDAPTIYTLLPKKYHHLQPVGRLDKDSSGALLLTNDGDFALKMTHPRYYKQKQYVVTLDKPLAPLHHQMINDYGITLPDGPSKLQLTRQKEGDSTEWQVVMHEGRNRQIRRTFAALGYTVTKLHRTQFGTFTLQSLRPGEYQELDQVSL